MMPSMRPPIGISRTSSKRQRARGFTLLEMVGVLAIIAVLSGMLLPRIFAAISLARVQTAALGVNSVRSAAMLYFTKYGRLANTNGAGLSFGSLAATNWDTQVLLREGFLEKPLGDALGTDGSVQIVPALGPSIGASGVNAAFNLDGDAATPNDAANGTLVLMVVFNNVPLDDARNLNRTIDGASTLLGEDAPGHDLQGRVKYDFGAALVGDVCIYLANR